MAYCVFFVFVFLLFRVLGSCSITVKPRTYTFFSLNSLGMIVTLWSRRCIPEILGCSGDLVKRGLGIAAIWGEEVALLSQLSIQFGASTSLYDYVIPIGPRAHC